MDSKSACAPSAIDLETILLKPLTERTSRRAFRGKKKLALLHSWDEIVYRDIGRVLEYKQFKQTWRHNVAHQSRLMENISVYKEHLRSQSLRQYPLAFHQYHYHPTHFWYGSSQQLGEATTHRQRDHHHHHHHHAPPQTPQKQFKVRANDFAVVNVSAPNNIGARCLPPEPVELAERLPLDENSQRSEGNMSYLSAANDISSSVSISLVE